MASSLALLRRRASSSSVVLLNKNPKKLFFNPILRSDVAVAVEPPLFFPIRGRRAFNTNSSSHFDDFESNVNVVRVSSSDGSSSRILLDVIDTSSLSRASNRNQMMETGSMPIVDMKYVENGGGVYISTKLPGVEKKDVKVMVSVEKNMMYVAAGGYKEEEESGRWGVRYFCRIVILEKLYKLYKMDDQIEAEMKNGVLRTIILKRVKEAAGGGE
ncbi:23.5 kDa heat shock protein, mitochondrial-like [Telopea speciosissima]|uniref:23.5 kDa heat shock protein, mitochondrial-like n=1 Tax=Telopea speciosissima TaxID=54955 RepID=UPI001CC79F43|nr:23.5 kDa heat shock protein, mitochondrial-like [Telopea speciosissima]